MKTLTKSFLIIILSTSLSLFAQLPENISELEFISNSKSLNVFLSFLYQIYQNERFFLFFRYLKSLGYF